MRNSRKSISFTARTLGIASRGVVGIGLVVAAGCNKLESSPRQADRAIDQNVAQSVLHREMGGNDAAAAVKKDLDAAIAVKGASNAGNIRAKSAMATEELSRALEQIPEINQRSLQIDQALAGLRDAGFQVQATQRTAGAYAGLEPKEALAKVEEDRTAIQKNVAKAKSDAPRRRGRSPSARKRSRD